MKRAAFAVGFAVALTSCGSKIPVVQDIPKPVRNFVEKRGCDAAALDLPPVAREAFLAVCYASAETYGTALHRCDGGAGTSDAGHE